jgi:hypothetical protein
VDGISVVKVDQGLLQIGSDDDLFEEIMAGVAASGQLSASSSSVQATTAASVKPTSLKDLRVGDDDDGFDFLKKLSVKKHVAAADTPVKD